MHINIAFQQNGNLSDITTACFVMVFIPCKMKDPKKIQL